MTLTSSHYHPLLHHITMRKKQNRLTPKAVGKGSSIAIDEGDANPVVVDSMFPLAASKFQLIHYLI